MAAKKSGSTAARKEIRELNMDEMSAVSGGYGVVGEYICPKCQQTNTVYSNTPMGSVLICRDCKTITRMS